MGFFEEIADEAQDFFEDFAEVFARRRPQRPRAPSSMSAVRPAYFFAQRVDNALRIVFGVSIIVSAATATFLGFSTLSELLGVLINSWWGRFLMGVIGVSYLLTATWRLMRIKTDA